MARATISNSSFTSDPLIKCLSHNPVQSSQLGDLGYLDDSGRWHAVLNIFDGHTCHKAGIAAIQRTHDLSKYITEKKHEPLGAPMVKLFQGGSFEILTPDQLAQYVLLLRVLICRTINSQSRIVPEKTSSEASASDLGLMIRPMPNMTTIAFIAGPKIFVRELHLPCSVLDAWLQTYRSKIDKSARKTMKQYPPNKRSRTMYLSLTEFSTDSWRTIFIRTDTNPSPIFLVWRTAYNDCVGAWSVIELPNASSVISGGIGSFPVHFPMTLGHF